VKNCIAIIAPVVCLLTASIGRCDLVSYSYDATVTLVSNTGPTPSPVVIGDHLAGTISYNTSTWPVGGEMTLSLVRGGVSTLLFDAHSLSTSAAENFTTFGSDATVGFGGSASHASLQISLQSLYNTWTLPTTGLPNYPIDLSKMVVKSLRLLEDGQDPAGTALEVDAVLTDFELGGPTVRSAPEPASLSLMAMGFVALAGVGVRRTVRK
jgi:hypothetical protein